ncbi:hypothetical protein MXB_1800 [Myxobolus squamalis]|nr:hypothetical protein MXB_1800 [Myxobolus squamalis]
MKALILVGGYGTRLRPLTLTRPKPLVEFCNKPILFHQMEALIDSGVDTIILAVSHMCDMLEDKIKKFSQSKNVKIIFSKEDTPLGTAGPLALARKHLDGHEPFFVLNSDITCTYPFLRMLEHHVSKRADCTIAVTRVDEPSKYGVIVSDDNNMILKFVEKPIVFISNKINAGIYVLNSSVLNLIPLQPTSIEKDIFPLIASDGLLYSFDLEGFWMDIGQPKDYLTGSKLYLAYLEHHFPQKLGHSNSSYTRGLIHETAVIGAGCHIEKDVVIGKNHLKIGVCLVSCVILSDTVVSSYSLINNSLIGWRCHIGKWARIQGYSVLAEDVQVADEVFITGSKICPHKIISQSIYTPEIVM